MKKLLFIHNKLVFGGAEKALYDLLLLLDKSKYDLSVFVIDDGGEWENKFTDAGIKVINSYENQVEGHKIENYILREKIKKSRKLRAKNLIKIAIKEKYDLYVGYNFFDNCTNILESLPGKKIRYVHGDIETNEYLKYMYNKEKVYFNEYNRIVCVSNLAKSSFDKEFNCKDKTVSIYNPIDDKKIRNLSEEKIIENIPVDFICAVGRLSPEKGYERLIKIYSDLVSEGIKQHLVIVGDGPDKEDLIKMIKELNVQNCIHLVGYKDNPYPYMKNSLFTIISSYTEGLPVVTVESLSLGVPIVSSYPSVHELFADECCGIITENDDESLKAGLRKMLTDKEFYKKACEGSKNRSAEFTSEKMISKVEQIFDEIMNED